MSISVYIPLNLSGFVGDDEKQLFPKTVEIYARPFLASEARELMQAHLGLTDKEREEKNHEHQVWKVSKIISKQPKNLTGFPDNAENLEKAVYDFFIEKTEINEIIVEMILNGYLERNGNRYFFR